MTRTVSRVICSAVLVVASAGLAAAQATYTRHGRWRRDAGGAELVRFRNI